MRQISRAIEVIDASLPACIRTRNNANGYATHWAQLEDTTPQRSRQVTLGGLEGDDEEEEEAEEEEKEEEEEEVEEDEYDEARDR